MDQIDEAAFYRVKAQVLANSLSRALDELALANLELENLRNVSEEKD